MAVKGSFYNLFSISIANCTDCLVRPPEDFSSLKLLEAKSRTVQCDFPSFSVHRVNLKIIEFTELGVAPMLRLLRTTSLSSRLALDLKSH